MNAYEAALAMVSVPQTATLEQRLAAAEQTIKQQAGDDRPAEEDLWREAAHHRKRAAQSRHLQGDESQAPKASWASNGCNLVLHKEQMNTRSTIRHCDGCSLKDSEIKQLKVKVELAHKDEVRKNQFKKALEETALNPRSATIEDSWTTIVRVKCRRYWCDEMTTEPSSSIDSANDSQPHRYVVQRSLYPMTTMRISTTSLSTSCSSGYTRCIHMNSMAECWSPRQRGWHGWHIWIIGVVEEG